MPHIENHERTLKAALTCDEELVVQAFLHDPVVKGKQPQEAQVRSLVHDMSKTPENICQTAGIKLIEISF